ncbi:MAG TPA: glycoside hydrolase family 48 protein [Streptosporangiaceae bacterium]
MKRRRPWRPIMALGAGLSLVLSALVATGTPASAAVQCSVNYTKNDWGTGFTANVAINNLGDPLTGWTLRFSFTGNQTLQQSGWNGTWTQSGQNVTVVNAPYNGNIATGGSAQGIGANFTYSGTNANPTSFSINNVACNGANSPPTVSITAPTNGQHFPAGSNVAVNATAGDASPGNVAQVDFFRNGMLVGTDTSSPYSFTNTSLPAGNYTLQARATDNLGATATAEVAIVVDAGPTLVVSPTAVSVPEGGTQSFDVSLSAQPSSSVTVTAAKTAGDADITVSAGGSRTFTTSNWNTPQTVTLAAAQDADQSNGQATITVSATGFPSVPLTATEEDDDAPAVSSYIDEFTEQYNKIHSPASGYFSQEGIPYHSIETLLVEAPDWGHETTSEAFSFWLWLEAQHGRVTGDWAPFNQAWTTMETYIIPNSGGQPGGSTSYNPNDPADYAREFPQPSSYPVSLDTGVVAGQDPLANELQSTYGNRLVYGMHWLLDVDDTYGYGTGRGSSLSECGDNTKRVTYINTYQRGPQESVWETVAHPSCETGRFGQSGSGYPPLFISGSGANQWRYTDAPDADARAVQAAYWALRWATDQGNQSQISTTVAKAAKMGDFLRYSFFDKYFKNPGCTSTNCTPGTGKSSSSYMLTWYYAFGGDIANAWSWRIGSSSWHQGYQNPLAAWALSPAGPAALRPQSPSAATDWQTSLNRQLDSYLWLQSAEGGIAGGATNSWNGNYEQPPAGTPTFYGWAYDFQPVFHDPPSNRWFGFQVWSLERVAEYYWVTGDAKAKQILDKWVPWALSHTTFGAGNAYSFPSDMTWSGAPAGNYSGSASGPPANPGLHVTVSNSTNDVGVGAAYARLLTWYAAKSGNAQAQTAAKNLIDGILSHKDAQGVGIPETKDEYNRFDDVWSSSSQTGLYIPPGFNGTMPDGSPINSNSTFLSIRPFYRNAPGWAAAQAYMNGTGPAPTYTFHRFWAQADVAMAAADFGTLFPDG